MSTLTRSALFLLLCGAWFLTLGTMAALYRFPEWWRGRRHSSDVGPPPDGRRSALPLDEAERNRQRWDTAFQRIMRDLAREDGWGRDLSGKRYESVDAFLADEASPRRRTR